MVSIVHNIDILTNLVDRFVLPEALKQDPNQLSPSQFKILSYLYTHLNVRPRDLAYALNITSPAATYALQKLTSDGFVEMESSTTDKREKTASLTEKGVEAVETITTAKERLILGMFEAMNPDDQESLLRGLKEFLSSAGVKFGPKQLCLKCGFKHSPKCVLSQGRGRTMED